MKTLQQHIENIQNKEEYQFDIELVLGDWSDDGHGKTLSTWFKTNLDQEQIEQAYQLGVIKIGVSICDDIAKEYQDSQISEEDAQKFVDAGFTYYPLGPNLIQEQFLELYLFTVKTGNPEFRYYEQKSKSINIGGYGLFW